MKIFILAIALLVVGCGTTGPTSQNKHLGSWYDFKTPGTPMQWSCTSSKTSQNDCSATNPKDTDENWMETFMKFLKQ